MQRHFTSSGEVICLPSTITLTGSIASAGTLVTGTGTDFVTDLLYGGTGGALKYQYLVSVSKSQVMEIVSVLSPTTLVIKTAFRADLTNDDFIVVNSADGYNSVSFDPLEIGALIANVGDIASALDENATTGYNDSNGLKPILLDTLDGDCTVTMN